MMMWKPHQYEDCRCNFEEERKVFMGKRRHILLLDNDTVPRALSLFLSLSTLMYIPHSIRYIWDWIGLIIDRSVRSKRITGCLVYMLEGDINSWLLNNSNSYVWLNFKISIGVFHQLLFWNIFTNYHLIYYLILLTLIN